MILTLNALGLGLKAARLHARLTLEQLSRASGLSVSFLSDVENDKTRPSLRTLQKLAMCYGEPFQLMIPQERKARDDNRD